MESTSLIHKLSTCVLALAARPGTFGGTKASPTPFLHIKKEEHTSTSVPTSWTLSALTPWKMCAFRNCDFKLDKAALKCHTTSSTTRWRFGFCFCKASAMTWLHFSSNTRSTFCTFTLAPCSNNRSVTRAEISSNKWSMERCSRAKCTEVRHKLSTEAYFRRMGPMSEKRLSLFTWSSVNFVLWAFTNSSNSCCIS